MKKEIRGNEYEIYIGNLRELDKKRIAEIRGKKKGISFIVDRSSVLGNPFIIGRDGTRDEVIAKYKRWLWANIKSEDSVICNELKKIALRLVSFNVVNLFCWCWPKNCHAEVIRSAIFWMIEQEMI